MNLKSTLRFIAIILLIAAFASLIKIPSGQEKPVVPSTELQKLLADRQYEAALKAATEAIRRNPQQDLAAYLTKGVALVALNQRQEAITLYQKVIRDFPDATEPYNNLAALYAAEGKYENARQSLEKALQIQGSYAVAYKNLNTVYTKLADQAYSKALDISTEKSAPPLFLSLLTEPGQPGKQAFIVAMSQFESLKPAPVIDKKSTQLAKAKTTESPSQTPVPTSSPAVSPAIVASSPSPTPAVATLASVSPPTPATEPKQPPPTATMPAPSKPIPVAVLSTEGKEPKAQEKLAKQEPVPADKSADRNEREIGDTVRAWAAAWSKQDIKAYLAFYASNFDPGNQSRSAWENDRRARIGGKARISVTVSEVVVSLKSTTSASVRFRQSYRSDRLNSQTGKTLVMERKGDAWKIVQERAGG